MESRPQATITHKAVMKIPPFRWKPAGRDPRPAAANHRYGRKNRPPAGKRADIAKNAVTAQRLVQRLIPARGPDGSCRRTQSRFLQVLLEVRFDIKVSSRVCFDE